MLDLYAWLDEPNFGDSLSRAVVEWLLGETVRMVGPEVGGKMLAIGSVLQYARHGDIVWGTGLHPWSLQSFVHERPTPFSLDVLAVRGPLTRDALLARGQRCPALYGDPGILLPLFHPKARPEPGRIVLVPHFTETASLRAVNDPRLCIADPAQDWRTVVDTISSASLVVSGSLHGLILAEAYGVPAVWFRPSHREGVTKYYDYYLGTGRIVGPCYSLDDALAASPPALPDFAAMQRDLMAAFLNAETVRQRRGAKKPKARPVS